MIQFGPEELIPLFSNEAEMCALGSMILSERAAEEVVGILVIQDFYRPSHRLIFGAMVALMERQIAIDLVTLRDELKARGNLADIGGEDYLIQVAEFVPSPANSAYYAGIVGDKAKLRKLEQHGRDIAGIVHGEGTADEKIALAERALQDVSSGKAPGSAAIVKDLAIDFIDEVDAYLENGKAPCGIKTGFYDLDWKTTGHYEGDFVIIGGRPAMGKTALALDMALAIAKTIVANQNGGSVGFFSLEMSKKQLMRRLASMLSGVSSLKMRRGQPISPAEYEAYSDACERLYDLPIYIDDTSGLTPGQMLSRAQKLKREVGLTAVFIDYLGLMSLGRKTAGATQNMDEITKELKQAARKLEVPVFALSQLSRAVETRDNKRPTMADVRDSGQIEANADLVLLLYRDSYYKAKADNRDEGELEEAEVIVAKQRNGETGTVVLGFEPHLTRYRNLQRARR